MQIIPAIRPTLPLPLGLLLRRHNLRLPQPPRRALRAHHAQKTEARDAAVLRQRAPRLGHAIARHDVVLDGPQPGIAHGLRERRPAARQARLQGPGAEQVAQARADGELAVGRAAHVQPLRQRGLFPLDRAPGFEQRHQIGQHRRPVAGFHRDDEIARVHEVVSTMEGGGEGQLGVLDREVDVRWERVRRGEHGGGDVVAVEASVGVGCRHLTEEEARASGDVGHGGISGERGGDGGVEQPAKGRRNDLELLVYPLRFRSIAVEAAGVDFVAHGCKLLLRK